MALNTRHYRNNHPRSPMQRLPKRQTWHSRTRVLQEALEPLAESRGRMNFGLIEPEFRKTSYPICGTSAASAYSHCKNAEGTDDVSQRDTFHILDSPASGASALAGRGLGRSADAPPQAVGRSAGLDPDRGVAALLAGPGGAPACRT